MSGVRGFVGVTDNSWYRLLADRPDLLGEVNFWRPGGGGFQALRPGEPFFFKTHAPHNRVVGGGFFGGAARLPASEAWDLLGPANGAISLGQMLDRIAHYRREPRAPGEDPVIGCIFIRDVTFFPDRPRAGTAIRWPRATPPRIPSRGRRNTGVPDPGDVPPAVATAGTTSTCRPGPAVRCVRRQAASEAPFKNKRRSANVGDAEVDA